MDTKDVNKLLAKSYNISNSKAEIIDVDLNKRIVTGFFNSYNYYDGDGDVLIMGCAKKSIFERGADSNATAKIKHALNHDLSQLIGKIQVLKETTINGISGIYFETKTANTTIGNDTLINYQEKVYDNHSIGFRYMDMEFIDSKASNWQQVLDTLINPQDAIEKEYLFLVKEIKLYEGSTVAFGANSLTPYLGAKSDVGFKIKLIERLDILQKQLKNGTQSDDMMETFELQILQIKQIINDIEHFGRPTFVKEPEQKKFDINKLTNIFQL